jgi:uncharacterized protein (DUF779 family)
MTRFVIRRVRATTKALELIERLVERHGPVAFFQSGECNDGAGACALEGLEEVHFVTCTPTDAPRELAVDAY